MTPTGSRGWLSVAGPAAVLLVWVAGCGSAHPIGGAGTAGSGAGTSGGAGHGGTAGSAGPGSSGSAGSGVSGGSGGAAGRGGTTGSAGSGSAGAAGGGSGGSGGSSLDPTNLIANFEDALAVVTMSGSPTRNGHWYAFNDDSLSGGDDPTCVQTPHPGAQYPTSVPPSFDGLPNNAGALHAQWSGCVLWGAIVGADLNEPVIAGGGVYAGPRVPYDLTGYTGITFWARSSPAGDPRLRVKVLMTDETKLSDGGYCDESVVGANKCSDDWGMALSLPTDGSWQQITVTFSDTTRFKQEGWGAVFAWNPGHVIAIQFQSQGGEVGQSFDFWLDDIYLVK